MRDETNQLEELMTRVRQGDAAAFEEFSLELEFQLPRIVRPVVRLGFGKSAVARWILAEVKRLTRQYRGLPNECQEWLIDQVARRLHTLIIEKLRPAFLQATRPEDVAWIHWLRSPFLETLLN